MSQPRQLTLVAPALDRETGVTDVPGRALATVMSRGSVAVLGGDVFVSVLPWQRLVAEVLSGENPELASAPVSAVGEGGALDAAYVLHATPVALLATTDRLRLALLPTLDRGDLEPLAEVLASRWLEDAAVFDALAPGHWYLRLARNLDAATVPLSAALVHEVRETLPQGPDAGWLRRVMTDAQMLLHEHPANIARERRGLPPVSGVWLWGGGRMPGPVRSWRAVESYGSDPYLAGLARLAGAAPPGNLAAARVALRESAGDVLVLADSTTLAEFARDWVEPAIDALHDGAVDRLLLALADYRVALTRAMLRRFWRRPRPLATWFA